MKTSPFKNGTRSLYRNGVIMERYLRWRLFWLLLLQFLIRVQAPSNGHPRSLLKLQIWSPGAPCGIPLLQWTPRSAFVVLRLTTSAHDPVTRLVYQSVPPVSWWSAASSPGRRQYRRLPSLVHGGRGIFPKWWRWRRVFGAGSSGRCCSVGGSWPFSSFRFSSLASSLLWVISILFPNTVSSCKAFMSVGCLFSSNSNQIFSNMFIKRVSLFSIPSFNPKSQTILPKFDRSKRVTSSLFLFCVDLPIVLFCHRENKSGLFVLVNTKTLPPITASTLENMEP